MCYREIVLVCILGSTMIVAGPRGNHNQAPRSNPPLPSCIPAGIHTPYANENIYAVAEQLKRRQHKPDRKWSEGPSAHGIDGFGFKSGAWQGSQRDRAQPTPLEQRPLSCSQLEAEQVSGRMVFADKPFSRGGVKQMFLGTWTRRSGEGDGAGPDNHEAETVVLSRA